MSLPKDTPLANDEFNIPLTIQPCATTSFLKFPRYLTSPCHPVSTPHVSYICTSIFLSSPSFPLSIDSANSTQHVLKGIYDLPLQDTTTCSSLCTSYLNRYHSGSRYFHLYHLCHRYLCHKHFHCTIHWPQGNFSIEVITCSPKSEYFLQVGSLASQFFQLKARYQWLAYTPSCWCM